MKHLAFVAVLSVIALSGCGSTPQPSSDEILPSTSDGHGDHAHPMNQMKAEMAKLSLEDAKAVEQQHFCPVSGEMLGSMGAPQKVEVNGKQVWICCDSCQDKLLAHPDEYLAKLKKE